SRRETVPPAASMLRCQASLRATSAPICSATVARSIHTATSEIAVANSWRRPASTSARAAVVASEPTIVSGTRWRRPKLVNDSMARSALGLLAGGADPDDVPRQVAALETGNQPGARVELPAAESMTG